MYTQDHSADAARFLDEVSAEYIEQIQDQPGGRLSGVSFIVLVRFGRPRNRLLSADRPGRRGYMNISMHPCIHTRVRACTSAHTHAYVRMCVHMYVCVNARMHACMCGCTYACMCVHMVAGDQVCTYLTWHIRKYVRTYIHTHIHAHTRTYILNE